MIAQIVNFLVLFFVLKKFLYKPVLNLLEKRRETIEKSLADAKRIEELVAKSKGEYEEELRKARVEAGKIIEAAESAAEAMRQEKLLLTKQDMEKVIEQGKRQLQAERESMLREVRAGAAVLVASATSAVLADIYTEKIDKALVQKALEKV